MATKTAYPASYNTSKYSYAAVNSSYPLSNPVGKSSSNTTYAQWTLKTGSGAESYVFYKFDLSSIPSNATIDSVACKAKGYVSTTTSSYINTRTMQMYYGTTTAKGSAVNLASSTTPSAQTITCGTWTRAELDDCNIRIYCKRGSSSTTTSRTCRFYGATLTVTYTEVSGEQFMIKTGGTWTNVSEVYKKENGSWVKQTSLSGLCSTSANYVKGN